MARKRKIKKEYTWGTPKRVILAETEVPDNPRRKPGKKNTNICKVLKREHEYSLTQDKRLANWFEYTCIGCGKRNWKMGTRHKVGNKLLT